MIVKILQKLYVPSRIHQNLNPQYLKHLGSFPIECATKSLLLTNEVFITFSSQLNSFEFSLMKSKDCRNELQNIFKHSFCNVFLFVKKLLVKKLLLKIKLLKLFSKKSPIKQLYCPEKPKKLNKKFGKFFGVFQTLSNIYDGRKKAPL